MRTVAEARRDAGIPETDYIRGPAPGRLGDTVERIATIRTLVRWFGPPDHRYEHIDCIRLDWSQYAPQGKRTVVITKKGSITS